MGTGLVAWAMVAVLLGVILWTRATWQRRRARHDARVLAAQFRKHGGHRKSADLFDNAKAVAGRRRWMRETATGRRLPARGKPVTPTADPQPAPKRKPADLYVMPGGRAQGDR